MIKSKPLEPLGCKGFLFGGIFLLCKYGIEKEEILMAITVRAELIIVDNLFYPWISWRESMMQMNIDSIKEEK
ncbi:hypothetical protein A3781_12600 [Bacillus badius]|nr:hypothetical protein A3781_12600 [Bacillus badius]